MTKEVQLQLEGKDSQSQPRKPKVSDYLKPLSQPKPKPKEGIEVHDLSGGGGEEQDMEVAIARSLDLEPSSNPIQSNGRTTNVDPRSAVSNSGSLSSLSSLSGLEAASGPSEVPSGPPVLTAEDPKRDVNSEICCVHGRLEPNKKKRRIVNKDLWDVIFNAFPHSTPLHEQQACEECRAAADVTAEQVKQERDDRTRICSGDADMERLLKRQPKGFPPASEHNKSGFGLAVRRAVRRVVQR